jgi:Lar family restriction alleviation protein
MTDNPDLAEAIRLLRTVLRMAPERDFISINGGPIWKEKALALLAKYPERPKLDGCPWCGGDVEVSVAPPLFERTGMRRVCCQNCQIYGPWGTDEADAAAAWNRRATPASGPLSGGKPE